jgi:hypothetical protein
VPEHGNLTNDHAGLADAYAAVCVAVVAAVMAGRD